MFYDLDIHEANLLKNLRTGLDSRAVIRAITKQR